MSKLTTIWHFISKHKYSITVAVFVVIICFLDENNIIQRLKYKREIHQLEEEIEKYRADYEESTRILNELTTNPEIIEQIAREKYLMQKPDEDIFVFDD